MIQFLVTAVIVVIGLFLLTLMLCLMIWVITKLLRFLFPQFRGAEVSAKLPKEKKGKKDKSQRLENRCINCTSFGRCPLAQTEVKYPCRFFAEQPADPQA